MIYMHCEVYYIVIAAIYYYPICQLIYIHMVVCNILCMVCDSNLHIV